MRKLILLVALCLLAGGVWLLSGLFSAAEAAPIGAPSPGQATEERATDPEPAVEPRVAEPERTVAEPTPAPDDGRFAYRIRAVRLPGDQPVAGAELFWLPPGFDYGALSEADRELQRLHQEQFFARLGEKAETDGEGRAIVRADPAGLYLLARAGPLYGQGWFTTRKSDSEAPPDPDQEFTLEMCEDFTLVVRAVDAAHRPLPDVHVRLLREHRNPDGETGESVIRIGPTDADGLAVLRHVQSFTSGESVLIHAELAVEMFGGTGEPTVVDLENPPREPVDVVAPPFGSLEIVLLGPDGRPWALSSDKEVHVSIKRSDDNRSGSVTFTNSLYLGRHGRAVAEPVLCGQEFRIWAWSGTRHEEVVPGPLQAGERVRVELRMPADTPILVGRLVDGQGAPIRREATLKYEFDGGMGTLQIGVDENGGFRVPLMERLVGGTPKITVTLREERGMPTSTSGEATLPGPLTPGPNDVGDVVLAEAPVLVAGRVEWMDGTPMEPPHVGIERTRAERDASWEQAWDLRPELPGEGRFVVRGLHQGRKWRLRLGGDIKPMEPIEFEPGTRDLVIRVAKGGYVRATFLMEDGMASRWPEHHLLQFRLQPDRTLPPVDRRDYLQQHEREMAERGWAQPTDDGVACEWKGLAPGAYRLTVRCPGIDEPIADIGGIAVPDRGTADDPRLLGIDLRGRARRIHVTVTDEQGRAIRDDKAAVVLRGGEALETHWFGRKLIEENGRVPFLVSRPVDLIVTAPGFRTVDVPSVFADTTVVLAPAAEIRFRLVGDLPELPDEIHLSLMLTAEDEPDPRSYFQVHDGRGSSQTSPVSSLLGNGRRGLTFVDGIASFSVTHSETRRLRLQLQRRVERRWTTKYVTVQPATLELGALRDGQVIEVRLTPGAVCAAVEALMR